MKKQLDQWKPEEFEELGKQTMRTCWEVEQAMKTCAPKLHAYEFALRSRLQKLQSDLARVKHQGIALHEILYNRIVPANDAQMLAHARKLWIVACFTTLTGFACLVGNAATFYLMGAGPIVAMLAAIGLTALPLGMGHMAHEWVLAMSRWLRSLIAIFVVLLAAGGIVIAGQARREMIDRSMGSTTVNSYVDSADVSNALPAEQSKFDANPESSIRRTLGEGIFLVVLAAELALVFLVGWLIELYTDPDTTAWRKLQDLNDESSDLDAQISRLTLAPEVAKRCCVAGILAAATARPRRNPPYHRALTTLLMVALVGAIPMHAQAIGRYDAILIDTSASISRGGKTNTLFREYLVAARSLLLAESPSTRICVLSISGDSFGGSQVILKGWTPAARGVFTFDLSRARTQLAAAFEEKSADMKPVASATDIFGGLWHVKTLMESGTRNTSASAAKSIVLLSDMMNETNEFPMPTLIGLGPQMMLERAKKEGLIVPLRAYQVRIIGASTSGLAPRTWETVRQFWILYFAAAGAELVSYSSETDSLE